MLWYGTINIKEYGTANFEQPNGLHVSVHQRVKSTIESFCSKI